MSSRRNLPSPYEEHASRMMRHGSLASEREPKLASQAAEIKRLAEDNHKLATMHLALRRNLVAEQDEAQKLRDHIRSTRTEGDIQIRILLDKMAKMEADLRAGEGLKKDVQEAHGEAQDLVTSLSELTAQIKQGTSDLDNARADIKMLPDMRAELDNLRQDHDRLRETFEHEKGANVEKVEKLKVLEKDLVALAEEVEMLRTELSNAEKRATAPIPQVDPPIPQVDPYASSANVYQHPFHANGYANGFNGAYHHMVGGVGPEGHIFFPGGEYPPGLPPVMNGPMGAGFGYAVGPPMMNGPTCGGYPAGPPMMNGPGGGYPAGPPMMNGLTGGGYADGPPMMNGPNGGGYPAGPPMMNGPTSGGYPAGPPMMNGPTVGGYPVGPPPMMNGPVVDGVGFAPGNQAWGPPYGGPT